MINICLSNGVDGNIEPKTQSIITYIGSETRMTKICLVAATE